MASRTFAIDFGSDSIKIYRNGAGVLYFQKTVLAVKKGKNVIAVGNEAFDMFGKVPEVIEVSFPVKNGVIASFDKMVSLLNCVFLDLSREFGKIKSPIFHIAVPADITDIEKKAFYDACDRIFVRPKKIIAYDKPAVCAIGAGIDYNSSDGALIVDIGAQTTEISVIYTGTIVVSKLLNIGGRDIDESIINNIRKNYNLLLGPMTAENCKKKLASVTESDKKIKICGRDIVSGLPKEYLISSKLIRPYLDEVLEKIAAETLAIIERTPPEISADIYKNGLYITGGTSTIPGIDKYFKDKVGFKAHVDGEAADTVINGLAEITEGRYYIEREN